MFCCPQTKVGNILAVFEDGLMLLSAIPPSYQVGVFVFADGFVWEAIAVEATLPGEDEFVIIWGKNE